MQQEMITSLVALGATVVGNVGLIWWKWNDPAVLAKVAAYKQHNEIGD
jgi:hypothetical protein